MKRANTSLAFIAGVVLVAPLLIAISSGGRISAEPRVADVRDVENPARRPFQATAGCTIDPGKIFCANTFVVPANKLLVVETVSGFVTVPPGQTAYHGLNTSHEPSNDVSFFMPATFVSNDGTNLRFAVTQSMRAYAFPGTRVVGIGSRSAPLIGSGSTITTISGYLVDCGPSLAPGCPLP
jgi:hypothetical protein